MSVLSLFVLVITALVTLTAGVDDFNDFLASRVAQLGDRGSSFSKFLQNDNSNSNVNINNNNNGNNGNNGNRNIILNDEVENTGDVYKQGEYSKVKEHLARFYSKASQKHGQNIKVAADGEVTYDPVSNNGEDKTEMAANRNILNQVFENDILLTEPQARELADEYDRVNGRRKRKVMASNSYRWSTSIPYSFATSDSAWQSDIRDGIKMWQTETCLRFYENGAGSDSLVFTRGSGCYSNVGRIGGRQTVSIGYGCELIGIVAHEIGHALGFWHEQSRPDRDSYIKLLWSNMISGAAGQFEKRTWNEIKDFNGDYDLGSVMHYGPKGFTTDWAQNTIESVDSKYINTFGQRHQISFIDVKQVNTMYCSGKCSSSLPCQNGGYTDPNDCANCKCPIGLGGRYCQQVQPSNCGSELTATSDWQTLRAPTIARNQDCYWRITSPSGTRVMFETSLESYPCETTCASYLEIKARTTFEQTGPRYCCKDVDLTYADANEMLLIHHTSHNIDLAWKGFTGRYKYYGTAVATNAPVTRPPVTQPPVTQPSVTWSAWGGWSGCSATCGACGSMTRVRTCYGSGCSKSQDRQATVCNTNVCKSTTTTVSTRCSGILRVPCSLVKRVRLDPGAGEGHPQLEMWRQMAAFPDSQIEFETDIDDADNQGSHERRPKRQSSSLCEVPFSYRCNKSTSSGFSSSSCCVGSERNGICI